MATQVDKMRNSGSLIKIEKYLPQFDTLPDLSQLINELQIYSKIENQHDSVPHHIHQKISIYMRSKNIFSIQLNRNKVNNDLSSKLTICQVQNLSVSLIHNAPSEYLQIDQKQLENNLLEQLKDQFCLLINKFVKRTFMIIHYHKLQKDSNLKNLIFLIHEKYLSQRKNNQITVQIMNLFNLK